MRSSWCLSFTCFLITLLLCIQLVCAVPAGRGSDDASSSNSSSTTSSHTTSLHHSAAGSASRNHTRSPDVDGTSTSRATVSHSNSASPSNPSNSPSRSLAILPTPSEHHSPHPTWSHPYHPTNPPSPSPTSPAAVASSSSPSHRQTPVAIVFEVVAGAAALFVLLALGRCYWSYKRTPPRDRIGALLSRHQLEREMEEAERARMERFSRALDNHRWRPPPPPYQNAPAYEEVVHSDSIDWGHPSPPPPSHSPPP